MGVRRNQLDEATRRARRRVTETIGEARRARVIGGISQRQVSETLGCSRQLIGAIERGLLDDVGAIQLARYCAVVGIDLSVRGYPAAPLIDDVAQLRLLDRFRVAVGDAWQWRTEVPVASDRRDMRAVDAVLARGADRIGVEAVTRLSDVQAQVRSILLKQQTLGLECMILLLADTRLNREAIAVGAATLDPAFPMRTRGVLLALRSRERPRSNGLVVL